jgi:hypothetical protein
MKFLLGIPVAIATWFFVVFFPFLVLSAIFGQHSSIAQGVAAWSIFIIGPICAIAALIRCCSIDFEAVGTRRAGTRGIADGFFVLIRLPFFLVALVLWLVVAIPCLLVAILVCYLAAAALAVLYCLGIPFVIFAAALFDRAAVSRYTKSFRDTMSAITARCQEMQTSMWESPRKLFYWCSGA